MRLGAPLVEALLKSSKLANVCYDIRGPVLEKARQMEEEGHHIIKLNIGNIAAFGLEPPDEIVQDMIRNLPNAAGYTDSKGLFAPRKAIVHYTQQKHVHGVTVDDVYLGNGASELITMSMNALLNNGDEVLIPAPDYPLWTASVALSGGTPVHYLCDEASDWLPDIDDMAAKITPRTRAVVVINPNNPTGAVYPVELLEKLVRIAERHRLTLLSDEIYDEILYDGARFTPLARVSGKVPCLTFDGLSKVQRACGYRVGWLSLTGAPAALSEIEHGLDLLASLRLCANVPGQWAIAPSLRGLDTISPLTAPGGRLHDARRAVIDACAQSRFLDLVAPMGALYAFPSVKRSLLPAFDDDDFALDLLEQESVLIVPGSGFNHGTRNHFRITLLPFADQLAEVFTRIERTLERTAAAAARERHVA
jgi:alanine-synthesizing transaminase